MCIRDRRFLEEQGVDAGRLVAKGYGESNPIDKGASEAAHARNRRVEFTILEQDAGGPEVRE